MTYIHKSMWRKRVLNNPECPVCSIHLSNVHAQVHAQESMLCSACDLSSNILCAHHTNFPKFQLLGTCADLPGPAFLPTWPFMASAPPFTPFSPPPPTPIHLFTPPPPSPPP